MADERNVKDTTVTTTKLVVRFNITDKKYVTYSIADPSPVLDFETVNDWADDVITKEAFVIDGLPVTSLKDCYVETVTKKYLEAASA